MIIIIFQKHYINLPDNKYLYLFIFHILGVGPLQEISELLSMFFVVGTFEENGDGVQRLSREILS